MANRDKNLSRRIFLKGAGVAMTLPWLESLPVWGATTPGQKERPRSRSGSWCSSWAAA